MKKKTKKKNNNQINIIIVIIVAIILGSFIYYFSLNSNLETSLKKEGYITNKEDAFYKNQYNFLHQNNLLKPVLLVQTFFCH